MSDQKFFSFTWTTSTLVFSVAVVVVTAILCFLAWRRSGFARGTGLLEAIRLLLVTLVVLTLNQPEWIEQFRPDHKPQLTVLWDQSRSMETRDVIDPAESAREPKSRAESIAPLLEEDFWKPVLERMEVVFEPFSSDLEAAREGTDLGGALTKLVDRPSATSLGGVVLLCDGDWNVGQPPVQASTRLRMENVPVYCVGVGSDTPLPDIELVSFDVPTFGVVNKALRMPFIVGSTLPRDCDVTVVLDCGNGDEITTKVRVPAMGRVQDAVVWRPKKVGDYELKLRASSNEEEINGDNNELTAPVSIRDEELQVLLVESFPRWEYRYLRNALERDPGVSVTCLLFHPAMSKAGGGRGYIADFPSRADLAKYDIIFLGDVGVSDRQLTVQQCNEISQAVRDQAAGLIFMPGFRGHQLSLLNTALSDLYPVVLDPNQPKGWGSQTPGAFELTETGRRSLLTSLEDSPEANAARWSNLPGFQWCAAAMRAKAGSDVLAVHASQRTRDGRVPLIVTKTYGTGKVLFMGTDGAWRWRKGVEDKYHYRFWGQVARWMAYQRNMAQGESLRLFYSPDRPQTDDVLALSANVMSTGGEPMRSGTVFVQAVSPSGKTESIQLQSAGDDAWGLFTGTFIPREYGSYAMTLSCRETGGVLETNLDVRGTTREKLGKPARFDVLKEISEVTRGKVMNANNVSSLLSELAALPEPEPIERRVRIWCHPLWAGTIMFLLGVFWVGRKLNGAV